MKEKKENINFEALFREKLEYAEIIPDPSVKTKVMRRLEAREFFRFNRSRINIFYIGGLLAITGLIAIFLMKSDSSGENGRDSLPEHGSQIVDTNQVYMPVEIPEVIKTSPSNITRTFSKKEITDSSLTPPDNKDVRESARSTNFVGPRTIVEAFSSMGKFTPDVTYMNKLQGVYQANETLIGKSLKEGCTPLTVKFTNKAVAGDSCFWSFGDGGYSKERNPEWIFDIEGEYNVILNVYNSNGTVSVSSTSILAHPKPLVRFEISPADQGESANELRFINYSSDAVSFKWYFGDGNSSDFFEPYYTYSKSGNYNVKLVATSNYGCSDSLTILNAYTGNNYFIKFPNAFIPNKGGPTGGYYSTQSDEVSHVFHPVHSGVAEYHLRIFSKLGILVFESDDTNFGWDGYFKGQLSEPGVYIWKVRGTYLSGEPFILMGDLTVLKIQ